MDGCAPWSGRSRHDETPQNVAEPPWSGRSRHDETPQNVAEPDRERRRASAGIQAVVLEARPGRSGRRVARVETYRGAVAAAATATIEGPALAPKRRRAAVFAKWLHETFGTSHPGR